MKHDTVVATAEHAKSLGPRLRMEDVEDINFFSPYSMEGEAGLLYCILKSKGRAWAAVSPEGETTAIWGLVPGADEGSASVWMMTSNDIALRYRIEFLRRTFRAMDELHQGFPLLFTLCLADNMRRQRWLKWMGFVPFKRHSIWGTPVIEYVRIKT